jgi:aminoglycoside 3-N-acetyltransferase
MANDSFVKNMMSLSPHIEMIVRRLYWLNIRWLSRYSRKSKKPASKSYEQVDYDAMAEFLKSEGVQEGRLLLIHSSFGPFKGRGKTASQIIDFFLDMVGDGGTLAMPAMPKFKNAADKIDYLDADFSSQVYTYDVRKSKIKTGVLPLMLHNREGSVRSLHPINTMVAYGRLANEIMRDNLSGSSPLACGENSSWKRCLDNDALIIGMGLDLTHSLTSIHIAEDIKCSEWPIKNWYLEKKFKIVDGDNIIFKVLKERAPKWGALHFAERTLCKDLISEGLLKSKMINGINVEIISLKELYLFLDRRNYNGYPYFWT